MTAALIVGLAPSLVVTDEQVAVRPEVNAHRTGHTRIRMRRHIVLSYAAENAKMLSKWQHMVKTN